MTESKAWAHDLAAGIAAALGLFDAPETVDEALLARAIRSVAAESDDLGHMLLLRSLADALDHPEALTRLKLHKSKSGRPSTGMLLRRALIVGPTVARQVLNGVKKEAAIQHAMSEFKLSRSMVVRCTSEYEKYRRIFDPAQRDTITRQALHDTVVELDDVKARFARRGASSSIMRPIDEPRKD